MSSVDVLMATKDGKIKDVILLSLDDYSLEYAARHALIKIYGVENVFVGIFEIGSIPYNVVRTIAENPAFKKETWIPYTTYSAPASGARVLVKLKNGYINIANYFYSKLGYWKLDSGQEIDTVDEWRELK